MTYRQLALKLAVLTHEQFDLDVTICINNELYPLDDFVTTSDLNMDDVLGPEDHPVLLTAI